MKIEWPSRVNWGPYKGNFTVTEVTTSSMNKACSPSTNKAFQGPSWKEVWVTQSRIVQYKDHHIHRGLCVWTQLLLFFPDPTNFSQVPDHPNLKGATYLAFDLLCQPIKTPPTEQSQVGASHPSEHSSISLRQRVHSLRGQIQYRIQESRNRLYQSA